MPFFASAAVSLLSCVLAVSASQAPAPAGAKKDGRKEVAAQISEMAKDTAAKKDVEAREKMDGLLKEFPESGPKDKKAIADAIAKNLKLIRQPAQGSTEQPMLYIASVVALGQTAEFGAKHLQDAFENRDWKKDLDFRGKILRNLGTTKDAGSVDFLLNVLNSKDYSLIADAATALGNYNQAPEEARKKIVEKLQKHLNTAQGNAADPTNPAYNDLKKKYETINPAMTETLQKLTGQSFREPREWEKWWNENKSKNWT